MIEQRKLTTMVNPTLTNAIHAAITATGAVPEWASDDDMDLAISEASSAIDLVRRIPAFTPKEVEAKLLFANALFDWDVVRDRLIDTVQDEIAIIEWNAQRQNAGLLAG